MSYQPQAKHTDVLCDISYLAHVMLGETSDGFSAHGDLKDFGG